jgi:hypothetical protein
VFLRPAQPSGQVQNRHAGGNIKVFWFFSSEKNIFLVSPGLEIAGAACFHPRMLLRRAWLWLILVPIAIHWPALSGWLSADPLYLESGLTRSWLPNGVLPGLPGWIDGNSGITLEALGRLAAHDWKAGIIPWWNPYSGIGMPLAGEMQPAAFFLPFVLLLGIAGGVLYLKITLMIVAGLAMWGLLRQLGLAGAAAFTGALLFQLNGTFAWDADSSSLPVAFLPLFLLGIERALVAARNRAPGGWRLLCIAVAYSILAGFPETAFADGLLAFAWATMRFFQARGSRAGFFTRVTIGGLCGVVLCAPVLMAFVSFLGQSDMGLRNLGQAALLPANFAMFLFPYLYGPIFFNQLFDIWYRLGGYVGLPVTLLALAGVFAATGKGQLRERGLRWVLAGWIVLALAKAGGVPWVTGAFNLIPLVAQSLFFRYAATSWECAAIILAALALDDFLTKDAGARRRPMIFAGAVCVVLCVAALVGGRPVWRDLGSIAGGRAWFFAAVGWGFACTGVIAAAWLPGRPWRKALFGVLLLDAAVQFSLPLLSGTRGEARRMDMAVIAFLKQNLGLNRIYTLGPLPPNYGAFYQIAEINHDYAPVPAAWVDYVHAHLDPLAIPITFNGFAPPPANGVETRPEALRRRFTAYANVGVKYVLTPKGTNPFAQTPPSVHKPAKMAPLVLRPGQEASGRIDAGLYGPGPIGSAGLTIATFKQRASGQLALKLCAGIDCATGTARLDHVGDNATAWFTLDHPITLTSADRLEFHISRTGGNGPIAIWLWSGADNSRYVLSDADGAQIGMMPELALAPPNDGTTPQRVFQGALIDIYELPNPAGYFDAPGCTLSNITRDAVQTHCNAPSRLLRRELWFPGWRATVNGIDNSVSQEDTFQIIFLPSGNSTIRFTFAPPYAGWAFIGTALSILLLLAPLRQGRKVFFF